MTKQSTVFMLVGLPGSGKSTYCEKFLEPALQLRGDFLYYSTDHYIDEVAKLRGHGTTYDDVFEEYIGEAERCMNQFLETAIQNKQDVIWDQTNLTPKARRKKLNRFPKEYRKVAIVFKVPADILEYRLNNRPGKTIPSHIIQSMMNNYVDPTLVEGFDEIVIFST